AISSERRCLRSCWSVLWSPRLGRGGFTLGCTGRRLSLRPPAERLLPISPTGRLGSVIPEARCCFSPACCFRYLRGGKRSAPSTSTPSPAPARRRFTGSRSPFRKRSEQRLVTGAPTL